MDGMSGPNETSQSVRRPAVAGRFYPADAEECRKQAGSFLRYNTIHAQEKKWIGGIVPHAGWICSGAIAGETIATLPNARVLQLGDGAPADLDRVIAAGFHNRKEFAIATRGRAPHGAALLRVAVRNPAVRAIVIVAWIWLGWHFFVRTTR